MPIYEYKCESCGHQVEVLQKLSDAPAKTCPDCGEDALKKLISAAAFKLTGTGWYETDFKDKKPKKGKPAATASTASKESGDSGESKKDTGKSSDGAKTTSTKGAGSE